MKIAVIGYSGAGKSTLAAALGERLNLPVLHLDSIHFLPGWAQRDKTECLSLLEQTMAGNNWIIDGNYHNLLWERRMAEADHIVYLNFPRLLCLWRVVRRKWTYRGGQARPSAAPGCPERLDWAFVRWVVWDGRKNTGRHRAAMLQYPEKAVELKSPGQVSRWLEGFASSH